MGCFSFLCKKSGEPALSSSYHGSPCYLFLLKEGKVIEEMYGNYDSYGRVFTDGLEGSFYWNMEWRDVCQLIFSKDTSNGIAMVLECNYNGVFPTTRSDDDPNQGWGSDMDGLAECENEGEHETVLKPYHKYG
jgi:hypothetical protein